MVDNTSWQIPIITDHEDEEITMLNLTIINIDTTLCGYMKAEGRAIMALPSF